MTKKSFFRFFSSFTLFLFGSPLILDRIRIYISDNNIEFKRTITDEGNDLLVLVNQCRVPFIKSIYLLNLNIKQTKKTAEENPPVGVAVHRLGRQMSPVRRAEPSGSAHLRMRQSVSHSGALLQLCETV